MNVRSAKISDVEAINALISSYAERDRMLFRSVADIYENLQCFSVAEQGGEVVGSLRYKYIRNDYPELPATPPADVGRSLTFTAMRRLRDEGKLNESQMTCFVKPRPAEELYDTVADPHEMRNLADDSRYADVLDEHRRALDDWSGRTGFEIPDRRTPDEFDRETGKPLPNRIRPRPSKKDFQKLLSG